MDKCQHELFKMTGRVRCKVYDPVWHKRSRIAYSDEVRNELLGDDGNSSESQLIKLREERAHLLDNTERLERSSRRLEAGYQIAVET
ncbi:PREDICTED: vesicle transport through interaction with t-SNAREs homolog 1A, partial [Mesitornis unicolor]|uniref:vesicle transport through interaction with t-SNAREs homolog 1A n=1 Tax=Mesitornis unicolor TaxID=54374 RepID=UPI0005281A4A